jgi:thiol:disulfide interchange protein DsbC
MLCGTMLLVGHSSHSADLNSVKARIVAAFKERFPTVQIEQVGPAPWPGLYEVVTQGEIAYTNADGSLLFSGRVLDTKTHEDLTQKRWNEINSVDFSKLPFDLAIITVKGNGSRKLAVFSDPDCPYCQQLEQSLRDVTNVTIYTFLYPLESVHPDARNKAVKIWCSEDRSRAWSSWMLERTAPAAEACASNPTATLIELGTRLKVNSTPTLFFDDGHRIAGAVPQEQLESELSRKQAM